MLLNSLGPVDEVTSLGRASQSVFNLTNRAVVWGKTNALLRNIWQCEYTSVDCYREAPIGVMGIGIFGRKITGIRDI